MVYCPKCGAKNEDDAKFCFKCGAPLEVEVLEGETEGCFGPRERRQADECFGLPHGGQILGIVIGLLIVLWGLIWILQQARMMPTTVDIWPFAVIIIGILIVAGALYRLGRR